MLVNKKCPKCGAEQKGLDLKESNGSVVCNNCGTQFKVNVAGTEKTELDESQLLLLKNLLEDDTQWDLMTDRELERRLKIYEKTKQGEDFIRALSCLRLATVFYLKAEKNSENIIVVNTEKGDYLPVYSSRRKIGKEDKQKYYAQETYFTELCKRLKDSEIKGIVLNCNTNNIPIPNAQLLPFMDVMEHVLELFDNMMEEGIEGEALTEIMFERFGGRHIKAELFDGTTVEGEVWSSHSENGNVCLDVKVGEDDVQVFKNEVKTIKAYPIE